MRSFRPVVAASIALAVSMGFAQPAGPYKVLRKAGSGGSAG